ncbi:MAG: hypothetical protein K2X11_20035, partial [Acetobacteraceae bacterium]|nr:hypothetical protein [Acetobacteraceae bacterium]
MSSQHTKAVVAAFVSALIASPAFAQVGRNEGISSDRPMVNEGSRSQTQTTQTPGPATASPQQSMGQGATTSSQPSGREALTQGGPTGTGRGTNPAANPGSFERTQAPADANRGATQGSGSTSPSAMGAPRGADGRPDPAVGTSGQASTTNAGGPA